MLNVLFMVISMLKGDPGGVNVELTSWCQW